MSLARRLRVLAAIVMGAVLLSACGYFTPAAMVSTAPSASPGSPGETRPADRPPIEAFDAVGAATAWVVTDRQLLATVDSGKSWQVVSTADVSGVQALVILDTQRMVMGAIDGLDVVVRTTIDGGTSWQESRLATRGQPGGVRLFASSTLLVVLVQQTTSSNFSEADAFVSQDGGAFERRSAPAAGEVSITGTNDLWLAGGVLGNQLWRSKDAGSTWSEIRLPSQLGTAIGVSAPQRVAGRLVLPVTINGPATQEALLTSSDDGDTWQQVALMAVGGDTGPGALPAAVAGDRVVVAGPAGRLFEVTAAGEAPMPVSPKGLPLGDTILRFTSATAGWALVTERGCVSGKTQCFEVTRLFSTSDGGQTWSEARLPG